MKFLIILLFMFIESTFASENKRVAYFAGKFYPSDQKELKSLIKFYFENIKSLPELKGDIIGLISPHAGYIFSGQIASYSYKFLSLYKIENPIIILIGQSHNFYLEKPVLYTKGNFLTPLGEVKLEKNFIEDLLKEGIFVDLPTPHINEHSLEVQLPFLQYIYSDFSIVPILVSTYNYDFVENIAKTLVKCIKNYKTKRKMIMICSTDMSHYPKYEDALFVDKKAIELIKSYDIKKYYEGISQLGKEKIKNLSCIFCGETAVALTMLTTKFLGANYVEFLKYSNSGDVEFYGDKERVVGYLSLAFLKSEVQNMNQKDEFKISVENQKILLSLARQAIKEYISSGKIIEYKTQDPQLNTKSAVFVTLTKDGKLRGCIGSTFAQYPLYQAVINMAIAAATEDPRFNPLTKDELKDIKIEISILSPLKRVFSYKDIKEKVHGVVVRKGANSGLFLPQVWQQLPKKEEFLSELCWSKAGLSPNAWQDPNTELYVFTVFSFEE